jgi:hypothetical protein
LSTIDVPKERDAFETTETDYQSIDLYTWISIHTAVRKKLAFIGDATPNDSIVLGENLKRTMEEMTGVLLDIILSQRLCCQNNIILRSLR